ncbi:MAG: hypothetical protein CVV64_06830 [Candidatus Wallbacteria bacterium HGW-Wallbacteria-1]|jgi:murein DD-endopeptidase MepM/ murein hydrolase activator NlpD|uniref:LysM domain-containing protein n=1 Tax=Candidatus Wallbacteria bacterium HGW-Wallbacteria-1 TaxID=2013854 RepID=A0A2N1PT02_9BACT|nr:MAG: hypothetical protein CVV64_06830 [Candidatus Wallbacteria bacterium HGW-Wallbacteria-1]
MKSKGLIDGISKLVILLLLIEASAVYLNMEKNSMASMEINDLTVKTASEEVIPPGDAILFGRVSSKNYRIFLNRDYVSSEYDTEPMLNTLEPAPVKGQKTILMALRERAEDIKHGAIVHIVKSGETMDRIAELYGINAKSLCLRNSISVNSELKAGQVLRVVPRTEFRYTVRPGDTLWSISNQYSIDSMDFIQANSMTSAMLRVGQELVVPWEKRDREWRRKYLIPENETPTETAVPKAVLAESAIKPKPAAATNSSEKPEQNGEKIVAQAASRETAITENIIVPPVPTNAKKVAAAKTSPSATAKAANQSRRSKSKRSNFLLPVPGKCTVVSSYGMRNHPVHKRRIFHAGVDIRAKTGTRLLAAASGRVDFAGWLRGYGRIVIIKHAKGYSTRYAHMSEISVKKGQTVNAGQSIGKSGKSGTVTGPHLHYEIRRFGRTLNPAKYL